MAPWCLFDSTTRKFGSTHIALGHLLLEVTGKRLGKEEVLFNYFDEF